MLYFISHKTLIDLIRFSPPSPSYNATIIRFSESYIPCTSVMIMRYTRASNNTVLYQPITFRQVPAHNCINPSPNKN